MKIGDRNQRQRRVLRDDDPTALPGHPPAGGRAVADVVSAAGNGNLVNGVLPVVITMAACQRAWAKRFQPWTLREDS